MTGVVVIMRHPVLPEDEGRHQLAKVCQTREEADKWIVAQRGEYFGPGDYYIAG
jgi:hypothetical protein